MKPVMKGINSLRAVNRFSQTKLNGESQSQHPQSAKQELPVGIIGKYIRKDTKLSLGQQSPKANSTTIRSSSANRTKPVVMDSNGVTNLEEPEENKMQDGNNGGSVAVEAGDSQVTGNENGVPTASVLPTAPSKKPDTNEEQNNDTIKPSSNGDQAEQQQTNQKAEMEAEELKVYYSDELRELKQKQYLDTVTNLCQEFVTLELRDTEQEGQPYTKACRNSLLGLAKTYFFFKLGQIPYRYIFQYRLDASKVMITSSCIEKLCKFLEDGLRTRQFVDEEGKSRSIFWLPLKNCLLTLLNFSDVSDDVKLLIGTCGPMFKAMVQLVEDWREDHMNKTISDDRNKYIKWCLSLFHNCGALDENIPFLRELGVIQVVIPYMDSPVSTVRLTAVATLAGIVNEEEAELLQTHVSSFRFMLKVLKNSLIAENHKNLGWGAEELTKAVRQLARNDTNKKILVDEGALPLLVKLVKIGDEAEVKEAINCLWVLSFHKDNKARMVEEDGLIPCLEEKFIHTDGTVKHACHGVLWSLREQINAQDTVPVGETVTKLVFKAFAKSKGKGLGGKLAGKHLAGHVMVSYQWANQELIKRIVQELRAHSVPVWLDIDYMGGSTLQAMAQAVEDSSAVIIAMSQKYKDSPNTRAEAEYAFQQRKKIIPLIMQRDYQPDGWLGFILGSKLYYDFSGKHSYESRMDGLLKAILDITNGDEPLAEVPTLATRKDVTFAVSAVLPPVGKAPPAKCIVTPPTFDPETIKKWTPEDKAKWLTKHNLKGTAKLEDLSGEEILFMHNVKQEAPEFFYRCLESKLGFSSMLDLARVSSAFTDLSSS